MGEIMETKKDKFIRLAEKRVNYVIKELDLIGNLSNKSNYDYEKEDVDKIVKTLKKSILDLELKFEEQPNEEDQKEGDE